METFGNDPSKKDHMAALLKQIRESLESTPLDGQSSNKKQMMAPHGRAAKHRIVEQE